MEVTNIASSTVIISSNGFNILCDPWLFDGEYYGSWYHYPPLDIRDSVFNAIDYIYLSHIHPDHFSRQTFSYLDKKIPVLIHRYETPFLRRNLELMGFSVFELDNGSRFSFNENFFIEIYAADNCNPELCGKFFGCGVLEAKFGSTQIDSLAVFGDQDHTILNLNDCPFELTKDTINFVKNKYNKVDLLLVGYAGAGPFPQCFNLDEEDLQVAAFNKQKSFINQAKDFINLVKPNYYMPFAGTYVLGGKLAVKNDIRGVPDIFRAKIEIDNLIQSDSMSVLLNPYQKLDLSNPSNKTGYIQIDEFERENYINSNLANKKFSYENDAMPKLSDFQAVIPDSWARFKSKVNEIGYTSNTYVLIDLVDGNFLILDIGGLEYIIDVNFEFSTNNYLRLTLDSRLLLKILNVSRFAHWNNASVGSHIYFDRSSMKYDRGLHYCLNFLHK